MSFQCFISSGDIKNTVWQNLRNTAFTATTEISSQAKAFSLSPGGKTTFKYDYTVTAADVAEGRIVNTAEATGTDAGEYPVNVTGTAVVKDAAGTNVTAQFTVKTEDGQLNITKRSVVLKSETAEKELCSIPSIVYLL